MRKDLANYDKRQKFTLDDKDKAILQVLFKNPRAPISIIAEQCGMLRDSVRYRVKKLEEAFLIYDYHLIVNPKVLGYEYFSHVFIQLEPVGEADLQEFHMKLEQMANITHITKLLGPYDLVLTVAAHDAADFARVVNEIKSFPEKVLQKIETGTIVDETKINDFSQLIAQA
jgi:DNA-binding Lrp family transcriptional regulator